MFRMGTYKDERGVMYSIYEVEFNGFYRYDIYEGEDAEFHIGIDDLVYSEYIVKKKHKEYGNKQIYNKIKDLMKRLDSMDLAESVESDFKESEDEISNEIHFITEVKKTDGNVSIEIVLEEGSKYSEYYYDGVSTYFIKVSDRSMQDKLVPINAGDYTEVTLEDDLEVTTDTGYYGLEVLRRRFDLEHLRTKDYDIIHNVFEGHNYIKKIYEAFRNGKIIGVDTETTNLNFNCFGDGKLVGIIVSVRENEARYFPFGHDKIENLPMSFLDDLMKALIATQGNQVAHNTKFDHKVFYHYGYDWCPKFDSMICSFLVDPTIARGKHSLKSLELKRSGLKYIELEDIFINKADIDFSILPEDLVIAYACPDADNARRVLTWKITGSLDDNVTLKVNRNNSGNIRLCVDYIDRSKAPEKLHIDTHHLPKDEMQIFLMESELANLKGEQEYWGLRIDEKKLKEGTDNTKYIIDRIESLINALTKQNDLKLSSPQVLSDLLYKRMKCKVLSRTKTGKPSTGMSALDKLSNVKREVPLNDFKDDIRDMYGKSIIKASKLNNAEYPVVVLICALKKYKKLMTAFYNRLNTQAVGKVENGTKCLRYFFWINQNGAGTGRQSTPAHQFPKAIKECILSDNSESLQPDTDFGQIELRLMFSLSGEKELIELAKDDDVDIHRAIQKIITGKEVWAIDADERQLGKRRNFGVIYLISPQGLAAQIYGPGCTEEQVATCKKAIDDFFNTFKRISLYLKENKLKVQKQGYMKTKYNRYRYFPALFDKDIDSRTKASNLRMANNLPVQGTAADIMKLCEINFQRYIKKKGWDKLIDTPEGRYPMVRVMLSAHDEALQSYHCSIPMEEIMLMNRECMEIKIKDFAPLFAQVSIASNWEEGHGGKFEIPRKLRDRMIDDYVSTGKSVIPINDINAHKSLLEVIKKYKEDRIHDYMEDLVAKYHGDAQQIADHVRHPLLTHELIGRFPQSEEHEAQYGKLEHIEHIKYSVDRYLEFRESGFKITEEDKDKDKVFELRSQEELDAEINLQMQEATGLADKEVELDVDGNPVFLNASDEEDYEEEIVDFAYSDEEQTIEELTSMEYSPIQRLHNIIQIETCGMSMKDADKLVDMLKKYHRKDGFYKVLFIFAGRMLDVGLRVEDLSEKEVRDFIESKVDIDEYLKNEYKCMGV